MAPSFSPLGGRLGIIFADLLHEIGGCRLPFCVGPTAASQLFACWETVTDSQIGRQKWALTSDDPSLKEFFEIIPRNVSHARIRLTNETFRRQMGSENLPQEEEGHIINEPPNDKLLPLKPEELLLPQRPFLALGPKRNTVPNTTTPERDAMAPPSADPDSRVPRVAGDSYVRGAPDFSRRYTLTAPSSYLIAATQGKLKRAGDEPTREWPAYSALYPGGNPAEAIRDPVSVSENFLNLETSHGWVTGEGMGPLASALKAAKAAKVDPGEFRTLDESAHVASPYVSRISSLGTGRTRRAR